jgi:GTPase SAR1 family protein
MSQKPLRAQPETKSKIGIIGPKEVGKTTLANLLNGHLKSLGASCDLVHESARYSPLPLNKSSTVDTGYWLLGSQIAAETLVHATRQFTICDRTVLDVYPFAALAQLMAGTRQAAQVDHDLRQLKILISEYVTARPCEFLFYIPIRRELWKTYSEPSDAPYQLALDKEFRNFLAELKLSFVELKAIDDYERLQEAMQYIQEKYRFPVGRATTKM